MLGDRAGERWVPSAELAIVDDHDAIYVLDLSRLADDGVPRSFTGSGAEVWRRLDGTELGAVVHSLIAEFDADPTAIEVDVLAFIDELVALGLLVPAGDDLRLEVTDP